MLLRFSLFCWALCGSSLVSSQYVPAIPITGAKVPDPRDIPLRKNINDLQNAGGPQWDLYIRSLNEMYADGPRNQLSYFQISGIHGQPYVEWNGAGKGVFTTDSWKGYCPHGEKLFLPWHRPYLMLFEQRLVEVATRLAKQYPKKYRDQYIKAAQTLRAPFWDWGQNSDVPPATVPGKMKVNVPKGDKLQSVQVTNPLSGYKIPQQALDGQFGVFDDGQKRVETQRCLNPEKYPDTANQLLRDQTLKRQVYDTFTRSKTFDDFGSTSGEAGFSLELIHNTIHQFAACGNQFTDADLSAFDPLFMLHHCNVDRLWAYWQYINPSEASFKGSYQGGSRFATPQDSTITPSSPLQPFFISRGKFHTSNSVQSLQGLGYSYEALEYWRKSAKQLEKDAKRYINQKYGPGKFFKAPSAGKPQDKTRYFTHVTVNVEELPRPCALNFFINGTRVGSVFVLRQPRKGMFNGKFALDNAITPEGRSDADTKVLLDSIVSTITVEIKKRDGTTVPVASVKSLKLDIESVAEVAPENTEELPKYKNSRQKAAPKKQRGPRS